MKTPGEKIVLIPVTPCPPDEFSGRYNERKILKETLDVRDRGKVLMISGARGSGKSSLLDWAEYEMQKSGDGPEIPAVKENFLETSGMVLVSYKKLLKDIQSHTKFGWFKGIVQNESVHNGLTKFLEIVEEYTTPVDPVGFLTRTGGKLIDKSSQSNPVGHDQVLTAFLDIFKKLSFELSREDRCIAFLLDDAQWSSDIDFQLLKDLIRNIPPRIALILAYRLEKDTTEKHSELLTELKRYNHREIRLGKMESGCIQEISGLRYGQSIDEETAVFLRDNIGDPLCLIACLNLLQKKGLPVDITNVSSNMQSAIEDPVEVIYSCLDDTQIEWANRLCVLNQPMPLAIMACMLKYPPGEVGRLQDELKNSYVFSRVEKGRYEFSHPSLREFRKDQLPGEDLKEFHRIAEECLKSHADKIPDKQYLEISIAGHAFYAEDYQTAYDLNFKLGDSFYDNYLYSSALEFMTRAKDSAEKMGDNDSLAAGYYHLGKILYKLYQYPKALENYEQCLSIEKDLGDRFGEASTLHQIGMVYEDQFLHDRALENYEESLSIKKELGDRFGEASTFHEIGIVYAEQNHYDKALKNYEESLSIKKELGDRLDEAMTLHQIGMVYQEQSLYKKALKNYEKSLLISRELSDRSDEAITLHQIGMVYQEQSLYKKALKNYEKSLLISRELGDRSGEASTLHQIGTVYAEQNQYARALENYEESLSIKRELGNRSGEVLTLAQKGVLFRETSRYDESVQCFGDALSITLNIQKPMSFLVLSDLTENLVLMGEKKFVIAWKKAFDGEEPPLEAIREVKAKLEKDDLS